MGIGPGQSVAWVSLDPCDCHPVRDFCGITCNTRGHPMNDGYTRITAPAGFDGQATRRDYYFKTRNAAREFRLRIKRWKAEQKYPADTLSFDDSDKRWLAYLRAHVGNLELLPAIVTHWERTAKPISRPLKVEELCKDFVLHREGKGLDKRHSPRTATSPDGCKNIWAVTWPMS